MLLEMVSSHGNILSFYEVDSVELDNRIVVYRKIHDSEKSVRLLSGVSLLALDGDVLYEAPSKPTIEELFSKL